jgi:FKBP-type peptidyl-prolyl cis-trans isomerase FkpA
LFRLASICLLAATLSLSACGGDSAPPTTPTPPPPTGPATLQITDLVVGTGQEATGSVSVTTHYTVWLYDPAGTDSKGRRVQSSTDSGNPLVFRLGTNAVIAGFEQGVIGTRVGGKRRLIIPPSLAYGSAGAGSIPGNSWLVFEIDLQSLS